MKNILAVFFMFLAGLGLIASLIVHVASWFGTDLGLGQSVFALHIGIFVVWFPAVLFMQGMMGYSYNRKDYWKIALRGCPTWMRYMTYGFFVYAILNFVLFIFLIPAIGRSAGHMPSVVHGFSGHWMAFYSAAFSILYSRIHLSQEQLNPKCRNGHPVSPAAKFCEICGTPIEQPSGAKIISE